MFSQNLFRFYCTIRSSGSCRNCSLPPSLPPKGTMSMAATRKRKCPVVPDQVSSKKVGPKKTIQCHVLRLVIKYTLLHKTLGVTLLYRITLSFAVIITLSLDNGLAGLHTIPSAQLWLSTNELQNVCSLCTVVVVCIGHRKNLGVKLLGIYTRLFAAAAHVMASACMWCLFCACPVILAPACAPTMLC